MRLIGVVLLLALLTVVLVQGRQYALSRQATEAGSEYGAVPVYQVQYEYQRLLQQWQAGADERKPLDARSLQLRYDIWVSRLSLLQTGRVGRLVNASPADRSNLEMALAFVGRADRVLGTGVQRSALTRDFLQAELPALRQLAVALHELTLSAAEQMAQLDVQRHELARQQTLLSLGLTACLCLLTLAFAMVAARQLRQSHQRGLELRELAQRLRAAQQTAERANAAKSEFLAHLSHEVRTPFHGVMGMLSLLRGTELSPQQTRYLRGASDSADHLLDVLNDILDLSQLETGRLKLAPVEVALRLLLHDIEPLIRPLALAKGLAFHIDVLPATPEAVLVDPLRVRQVLINLLSNAIEQTERGAVALELRPRQVDAGDSASQVLEFCVSDTGPGMDAGAMAKLFERRGLPEAPLAGPYEQLRLGLEIALKLARAMGGDLLVRSKPGQGSSFTFRLPLVPVPVPVPAAGPGSDASMAGTDADAELKAGPAFEPRGRAAGSTHAERSLRVLLADDNLVNAHLMQQMLESMGHQCQLVSDGQQALTMAQTRGQAFDLVMMDVHMPAMDGLKATLAIRALPDTARSTVPIVALTADAFDETRDRCLAAGMNGFLSKPVKPEALTITLRRLFGPAVARSGPRRSPEPAFEAAHARGTGDSGSESGAPVQPRQVALDGLQVLGPPSGNAGPGGRVDGGTDSAADSASDGAADRSSDGAASRLDAKERADAAHLLSTALIDMSAVKRVREALPPQAYSRLARRYFADAPAQLQRFHAAMRDAQSLDLRYQAHDARGAALNLGFAALGRTAQALQQGASHLPAHEIALLVRRYEEQLAATLAELLRWGLLHEEAEPAVAAEEPPDRPSADLPSTSSPTR